MVVDFDVDGDGKVTLDEIAMKERMLEVELREEKAESQNFVYSLYVRLTGTRSSRFARAVLYCTDWRGCCLHGSYSLHGW